MVFLVRTPMKHNLATRVSDADTSDASTSSDEKQRKLELRRKKNKDSASVSRQRRMQKFQDLELNLQRALAELESLRLENQSLRAQTTQPKTFEEQKMQAEVDLSVLRLSDAIPDIWPDLSETIEDP